MVGVGGQAVAGRYRARIGAYKNRDQRRAPGATAKSPRYSDPPLRRLHRNVVLARIGTPKYCNARWSARLPRTMTARLLPSNTTGIVAHLGDVSACLSLGACRSCAIARTDNHGRRTG